MNTFVPTCRLAPVVRGFADRTGADARHDESYGLSLLSSMSGVPRRTLRAIKNEERQSCSLPTADKILVAIGCVHLWHLPADAGGFADIYELDAA